MGVAESLFHDLEERHTPKDSQQGLYKNDYFYHI